MREGTPLWEPPAELREQSALARFMRAQGHEDYASLWQWSIDDLEGFWGGDLGLVRRARLAAVRARAGQPRRCRARSGFPARA